MSGKRGLNKAISILLSVIAALLFTAAVIIVVRSYWPHREDYGSYKNDVSVPEVELAENPINFEKLKEQNADVCGWINFELPELQVDHPILCPSPDEEEEYYLHRNLEKKYDINGTIFIQKMNSTDFSDRCTVIYGHNMNNGSMFGSLKKFRDAEFFEQNKYFTICTPGHILKYVIKSAFVYDDRHINNSFNNFATKQDFMSFANEVANPTSLVKNVREDVEIKPTSKLAVLSTCVARQPDKRYLVVGVLESDIKTK